MSKQQRVRKISAECVSDAAKHAAYLLHDSVDQGFKPLYSGDLCARTIGKIGEILFWDELCKAGIDVVTTPIRTHYEHRYSSDGFVLDVDGEDVRVEIKTTKVLKPLVYLSSGFRFFLNASQQPYRWNWVVSTFINTIDLTYLIAGCVEREHVGVYPIAGSKHGKHYDIPTEFLLPVQCIWEDCAWKDQ
jgi:hypothetical protein